MPNTGTCLRLLVEETGLELLRRAPDIEALAINRGSSRRFERIYYDTPDRRLARRHLTVCVCAEGRGFRQILEAGADDAPGTALRGVWEGTLKSAHPDLKAVASLAARDRVGLIVPGELEPVLVVRGSRHTRSVKRPGAPAGAELRITFIRGESELTGTVTPIAVIEIEPNPATPAAHFALALELHALVPVRWQTRSEAARFLTALAGEPPPWCKAEQPVLTPGISVSEGLAVVVGACLAHWRQNEEAALEGSDPEGIHQLRVAVRRLHSALSVFAEAIPQHQRLSLRTETKWLLTSLGTARDLDVFLTDLLAPVLAARPDDSTLVELRRVLEGQRLRAYETARAAIRSPRYAALMLQVGAWWAGRGWRLEADPQLVDRPLGDLAERLLQQRQRQAKKRGRGFAELGSAERHRVRIALKRLRYASEFFSSLYPSAAVQPYLSSLKALQDNLGHLNDVAVAEQRLADVITAADTAAQERTLRTAAGLVTGWYSHSLANLEPELVAAWKAFAAQPALPGCSFLVRSNRDST